MRAGLFAVGAAIAVIGVGVLLASLTFSGGPTVTQIDTVTVAGLLGHSFYERELAGVSRSSATTHVVWDSTQSLLVAIYPSVPCPQNKGVCPGGQALQSWWDDAGSWSVSGGLSFPLFLNLTNPNGTTVSFSGSLEETYSTGAATNPTWGLWGLFLPLIGAIVLVAIGGVGIFLGLFLPRGVYSGPGPVEPLYDGIDDDEFDDVGEADDLGEDEGPPPGGNG